MQDYPVTAAYTVNGVQYGVTAYVRVPDYENTSLPIVVLLHGTSGDARDMGAPAEHPGLNHNRSAAIPRVREHGWRSYPGVSIWSHALDPLDPVTSWQGALTNARFRTVNYNQILPRGSLNVPIIQLSALMQELFFDQRHRGRSFVLLGHSRGGILARALLVAAYKNQLPPIPNRSFDLSRISRLITLHSPNQGTNIANAAISVNAMAQRMRAIAPSWLVGGLVDFLQTEAGALAYLDYAVGSQFLANLKASEPVPGVRYATWGGTSTTVSRHRVWAFTADSALPRWHNPPFYWRTVPQELGVLFPRSVPFQLPPELTHGSGDILVSDVGARLPGAPHRSNAINHAEALWHPSIQQQVIDLLRTP
jgi:predicted esterase